MTARASEATTWLREVPLAHRGLHGPGVPENSLAAFAAACAAGVGIELDVRLTQDGVPVVVHDLDLSRITGDALRVSDVDVDELEGLRLAGSDEGVPTLRAALDLVAGRVPVMVEVKNETARSGPVEAATAAVLADYDGAHCIASFNPLTVRWFARHAPDVARVLTGGSDDALPGPVRGFLRRLLRRHPGSPVALSWNVHRLDDPVVVEARRAGMPVTTWTVRTQDDLARARAGADQVIFEGLAPEVVTRRP